MYIVKTIKSVYGRNSEGKTTLKYELFQVEEQDEEGNCVETLPDITSKYDEALQQAKVLNHPNKADVVRDSQ